MKKIILGLLVLGCTAVANAQENGQKTDKKPNHDTVVVKLEGGETLNIGLKNKNKTAYVGIDLGVDLGWNRFITNNVKEQNVVKDLSLSKGPNFTLTLIKAYVDLIPNHTLRLKTSLGIDYNTYHFSNPVTLSKSSESLNYTMDGSFKKNLLRTTYLRFPLLLAVRPSSSSKFEIAAGAEIGLLLGAKTKQITNDSKKIKVSNDFNMNQFRQGFVLRIGYQSFNLYGKYYVSDLFAKEQGPKNWNSFSVGVSFGGI